MTRPIFLALIHRTVREWLAHREARQRQQRFARLCRVAPELSAAHDALLSDRRHHRSTRADIAAMRRAISERLRREIV